MDSKAIEPELPLNEFEAVLSVFGDLGHGRLWCTCGYLIWTCGLHKDCDGPRAMIETDHKLCTKKKK